MHTSLVRLTDNTACFYQQCLNLALILLICVSWQSIPLSSFACCLPNACLAAILRSARSRLIVPCILLAWNVSCKGICACGWVFANEVEPVVHVVNRVSIWSIDLQRYKVRRIARLQSLWKVWQLLVTVRLFSLMSHILFHPDALLWGTDCLWQMFICSSISVTWRIPLVRRVGRPYRSWADGYMGLVFWPPLPVCGDRRKFCWWMLWDTRCYLIVPISLCVPAWDF